MTWLVTLNGVSLATDMAQRAVIIKLAKGKNSGSWYEETVRFIDQNRNQLIGDLVGALRADRYPLLAYSRWATWEQDVLCRLPEPAEAQRVILERQGDSDCEVDEAEIIEEFFVGQLTKLGYCPQTAHVRIPVATAARWLGWAIGEPLKTQLASRRLHQMAGEGQLKRLSPDPSRTHGRGFVWTGIAADVCGGAIANDLLDRIAQLGQFKDSKDA